MIRIEVPGALRYRDIALRAVSAACRMVAPPSRPAALEDLSSKVMSAFGEAFNNIAIHGYRNRQGIVRVEIEPHVDRIVLRLCDFGVSFDPRTVPPPPRGALLERGVGTFIINSFMDRVAYRAGRLNVLEMTKHLGPARTPVSPRTRRVKRKRKMRAGKAVAT